jgi:opacity protein-like surface antigen
MFTNTKIALAAALILSAASAALANDAGKASGRARGSYAQAQVTPSPKEDLNPSTVPTHAVPPLTEFEKTWFNYQNHE